MIDSFFGTSYIFIVHLVPPQAIIQYEPKPQTFVDMKKSSIHSMSRKFSDKQTSQEVDIAIGCGNDDYFHDSNKNNDLSPLITTSNYKRRRLQHVGGQDDCEGSSNYFCWMSCISTPNDGHSVDHHLTNGDSLYCLDESILDSTGNLTLAVEECSDPVTGVAGGIHKAACHNVWYPTTHGVQSYLTPHTSINHNTTAETKYCYGSTAMYMQGFEWEGTTCVAILFSSWVLTSRGLLVVACFGSALLGILLEFVIRYRRVLLRKIESNKNRVIASAGIYGIQVTIGYAVMLIVMTYSGPLVLSIILGLAVGHSMVNWNVTTCEAISAEGGTPCCQFAPDDTIDDNPTVGSAKSDV